MGRLTDNYYDYLERRVIELGLSIDILDVELNYDDGSPNPTRLREDLIDFGEIAYSYFREYVPLFKYQHIDIDTTTWKFFLPDDVPPNGIEEIWVLPSNPFYPESSMFGPLLYTLANTPGGILNIGNYLQILNALRTFQTALGTLPTWKVVYNEDKSKYEIVVFPNPKVSGTGTIILLTRYNPFDTLDRSDWTNLTIRDLWLSREELIWIGDYVEALFKIRIGRIRTRFGTDLPAGLLSLKQDGDIILKEGLDSKKELEEQLVKEYALPPLPSIY